MYGKCVDRPDRPDRPALEHPWYPDYPRVPLGHRMIDRANADGSMQFENTVRFVCDSCRFATQDVTAASKHKAWVEERKRARVEERKRVEASSASTSAKTDAA